MLEYAFISLSDRTPSRLYLLSRDDNFFGMNRQEITDNSVGRIHANCRPSEIIRFMMTENLSVKLMRYRPHPPQTVYM